MIVEKIVEHLEKVIGRRGYMWLNGEEEMQRQQRVLQRLWDDMEEQYNTKGKYSISLSGQNALDVFEGLGYALDVIQAILNIEEEEETNA